MDTAKFGRALLVLGGLGLIASALWWAHFFNDVARAIGSRNLSLTDPDVLRCLWSSSGACGLVFGVANLAGATPYEPRALWISAGLCLVGALVLYAQRRP